ncbi:MAG: glycoside hydrolase family 18 protein [Bacteroidota bacterium]
MNNLQPPRLCAYWLGYRAEIDDKPTPMLKDTPDYVDVVVLAFALVRENNTIDLSFMLNPPKTAEHSIKEGIKALHDKNTKVMLSVGGWAGNCWDSVTDVSTLVDNIMKVVDDWDLDGVDIDYEGDRELDDWMKLPLCAHEGDSPPNWETLFKTLRKRLGPDRLLTAVTAGKTFYQSSLDELSWVFTMDYGSTTLYNDLTTDYLDKNPDSKFVPYVLGVSCIQPDAWGAMTVEEVKEACSVKSPVGSLCMQFWDLSEDIEAYTNQPSGTYLKTIEDNLPKG